jgi:hypothetical protein
MKILSIKQPWASLIVNGLKDIENRDWRTHHRGPVLVHASQRPADITAEELRHEYGVDMPKRMRHGGVVGIVDIVDCVDHHHSKWFVGKHGFVLKNPRRLEFYRCPGRLGILEAPPSLLAKLKPERRPSSHGSQQQ